MTNAKRKSSWRWTQKQAVLLSLGCLAAGVCGGLLVPIARKSAEPVASKTANIAPAPPPAVSATPASDPAQLKSLADAQAAPMIEQLKSQPSNAQLLVDVGNLYYDARQYPTAVDYYGRALKLNPRNASVRTDMGTGYWYMGDADRAIAEFDKALSDSPDNPNTLFNRGLVKWQAKKDSAGALADWQKLLAVNPDYQAKDQVNKMIAQVRQATAH